MKNYERKKKEKEVLLTQWFKQKEENDQKLLSKEIPETKKEAKTKPEKGHVKQQELTAEQIIPDHEEPEKKTTGQLFAPTAKQKESEKEPAKVEISQPKEKKEATPQSEIPPLSKEIEPVSLPQKIESIPNKETKTPIPAPPIAVLTEQKKESLTTEEIKEQLLEEKVIREFERILKDSRFEMRQLILEYNLLVKDADNLYETEEAKQMTEEMDLLLERLKKIKEQFKVFEDSINFDKIFQLEDHYFTEAIEVYKKAINEEHLIEQQLQDFKRDPAYVSIVEKIIEFEAKEEKLEQKVKQRQEELELRDEKLDEMKENYLVLEDFSEEMESIQKEQERILNQIEQHLKESADVTQHVEEQIKFSGNFLARHLMMLSLLHSIPTLQAAGIVAVTGAMAAQQMRNLLFPQKGSTKTIITYHVNNYHEEIKSTIHDVTKITNFLDEGIQQIQELKKDFEIEFEEYFHVLPEFKGLLEEIEKVEETLLEKQEDIEKIGKKLETSLEINDQKVYLYDRQTNNKEVN